MIKNQRIYWTVVIAFFVGSGLFFWHSIRIPKQIVFEYDYARDGQALKQMFDTDWDWLIPFSKDEYSVDLVVKYQAPQQNPLYAGRLIIKVARVDDAVVGFTAYYMKRQGEWFFNFLDVMPAYRGKGYARLLAQHAIDDMIARGAHRITLVTYPHNEAALALYRKLGFVEIGRDRQVELELNVR